MSKFKPIVMRSANGYDTEEASNEATIAADKQGESLTVQSQSEDADINVMMARFGLGQKLPENPRVPTYGDFSGVHDFHSAMEAITNAEEAFMEFPPNVRSRFENDPQKVLEFISNEANYEEAVKLGLMKAGAKAPAPVSPTVAAPAAPPPASTPPGGPTGG